MGNLKTIREDPPLPVYIALPETEEPAHAVILFMHRPGLDKSQKKVCEDLAKAGYVAFGTDGYRDGNLDADSYTDDTIFEDFEEVLQFAKEHPRVDPSKIGTIGFCMGGRHVYLSAAKYDLAAAVSYYGFPTRGNDSHDTPIDLVPQFNCPVLAIFGEEDHLIPMENVEKFKEVLLSADKNNELLICEDVGHGFLNPESKNYKQTEASRAWMKTLEHFRKHL